MECIAHALGTTQDAVDNQKPSAFDSAEVPDITLSTYLRRLYKRFGCSDSVFVCALALLDRLLDGSALPYADQQLRLTECNVHRLLLSCLLLAAKSNEDEVRSNLEYARAGGLSLRELNRLEKRTMQLLNYRLLVNREEYELYLGHLRAISRAVPEVSLAPAMEDTTQRTQSFETDPCCTSFILGLALLLSFKVPAELLSDRPCGKA